MHDDVKPQPVPEGVGPCDLGASSWLQHLSEAQQCLAAEDLHGALAWIEPYLHALDAQPTEAAAEFLSVYAGVLKFWAPDGTARVALDAATAVDDAAALHRLGYRLIEAQAYEPAAGVLARATRLAPERADSWHEQAAAHELLGRYDRAAAVLSRAPEEVRTLPMTEYLHAFARLMTKDPEPARAATRAHGEPADALHRFMQTRLAAMLARHDRLAPHLRSVSVPGARAWHAVWTGEAVIDPLATAPSSLASVRGALSAVADAIAAWGLSPATVTSPPDRDSEILARALSEVMAIPFARGDAARRGTGLVAVWDATTLATLGAARLNHPGRVLYVHHGRGEKELALSADLVGRLDGPVRAPWGHAAEVLALVGEPAPQKDTRPLSDIAAELAATNPAPLTDAGAWRQLLCTLAALPEYARPAALQRSARRGRRWRVPTGDCP